MDMPHAPMPPPPPGFGGPPIAIHVDDFHGPMASPLGYENQFSGPGDPLPVHYDDRVQTKSKNKDKSRFFSLDRIDPSFKGYMLVKSEAQLGQKATWARVYKRDLPVDDTKLVTDIKAHRERKGTTPLVDFSELSPNQQGIVNRLIAQHVLKEKDSNAEWVLADVQRFGTRRWGKLIETKKMQVILKRQDKNLAKPGAVNAINATHYRDFGEIIDLAEPLPWKKEREGGASKKGKKQQDFFNDNVRPLDTMYEPPAARWDHQEPVYDVHVDQHHQQHHQPQQHQPIYDEPMPLPMAPPHDNHSSYPPPHDMQMPMPPPPQQYQPPYPAPHQNPFTPNPDVMLPGQYDQPQYDQPQWQDNQPLPRARVHTPAADRRRSASARRLRRLETNVDFLTKKVEDWNVSSGDSSEGHRDRDSIFTDPRTGGTKTPLSSLQSEDMFPRGEYDHRKREKDREYERRQKRYRDEARERKYHRDERAELQTHRHRRDSRYDSESPPRETRYIKERERERDVQYSPLRSPIRSHDRERDRDQDRDRYPDTRPRFDPSYDRVAPRLRRAQTYNTADDVDDYPHPRSAVESRYLPSTGTHAPPQLQRRLTDYPSENYQYADYDEQYRGSGRRRHADSEGRGGGQQGFGGIEYEALQAVKAIAGAAQRRDEGRYGRRQSAVEPMGGYYV
ncbi:hypothetical protein B0A55_03425 [Friedmanniomyces simplex]|uniref:Uncharacterized protein n=1 Tax=Friedmanniomyces simplex TaxID=329884 RepID=A0A4U0XSP3_9PEZI|nr:hypothetical protein B0A55_03425 [Friedmanniomyces simplex]